MADDVLNLCLILIKLFQGTIFVYKREFFVLAEQIIKKARVIDHGFLL